MNKTTTIMLIFLLLITILIITGVILFVRTDIKDTNDYSDTQEHSNPNYITYPDVNSIVKDKSMMKGLFSIYYDKYIAYTAPNKKNIFIVASKDVTDTQVLYAYSVLSNYLNSDNGYDMDALANKIADSGNYIVMPGGADGSSSTPFFALKGQPLYYAEVAAPGSQWFMENDYTHRDATFEEILHFTHDYGIGTTSNPGVFPTFSEEIKVATFNALPSDKALWGIEGLWGSQVGEEPQTNWLLELEKEGSLEQEYLASVIDSYYGLWEAYDEVEGGMWGMYVAKGREDIYSLDTIGSELLPYFNEYITSMITLDSSFFGDFHLSLNESLLYTYKSQYYVNVRLTGSNNINLYGNAQDNIFIGNNGDNIIDGVAGSNIVQYDEASQNFLITVQQNSTIVTNSTTGTTDTLYNINIIRFTDVDIQN